MLVRIVSLVTSSISYQGRHPASETVTENSEKPWRSARDSPLRAKRELQKQAVFKRRLAIACLTLATMMASCSSSSETLTSASFSADGLAAEDSLTALFLGKSTHIEFNREDLFFDALLGSYIDEYARRCQEYLPSNKIEITLERCERERITRNGFGTEISRECINYVEEGTGLYAKPEMLAAKQEVERLIEAEKVRTRWRLITRIHQDPVAGLSELASSSLLPISDMKELVRKNECDGLGLARFEENLRRFAWNEGLIPLDSGLPGDSSLTDSSREIDYSKLVADLVSEHAQSWAVNSLVPGSVSETTVTSTDQNGHPLVLTAVYYFDSFGSRNRGSVDVHLREGLPSCMYFFDAPQVCRTPDRKIIATHIKIEK